MSAGPKFSIGEVVEFNGDFHRVEDVKIAYQYEIIRHLGSKGSFRVEQYDLCKADNDEVKQAEQDYIAELEYDAKVASAKYAQAVAQFGKQ